MGNELRFGRFEDGSCESGSRCCRTRKWQTMETGAHVNVWVTLQSALQDSIRLSGCPGPLLGFLLADRPDLHHTSPGVDGRTGRNFACAKTYEHMRAVSPRRPSPPTDVVLPSPFSPPPASLSLSLLRARSLTVLALWKVQSCQGECQTTAWSDPLNTHTGRVPHTHTLKSHSAPLISERLRGKSALAHTLFIITYNNYSNRLLFTTSRICSFGGVMQLPASSGEGCRFDSHLGPFVSEICRLTLHAMFVPLLSGRSHCPNRWMRE